MRFDKLSCSKGMVWVILSTTVVSLLYYSTAIWGSGNWISLHSFVRYLYYVPVIFAALFYGWRGALLVTGLIGVIFFPHLFIRWPGNFSGNIDNLIKLVFLSVVGVLTGHLVNRERKARERVGRLETLKEISRLLGTVQRDITRDVQAVKGMMKSFSADPSLSEGGQFTAKLVVDRANRLEVHLRNLEDVDHPRSLNLRLQDVVKIVRRGLESTNSEKAKDHKNVILTADRKIPMIPLDRDKFEFAISGIVQYFQNLSENEVKVHISASKERGEIWIDISNVSSFYTKHIDPFGPFLANGIGYLLSLSFATIREHGGSVNTEWDESKGPRCRIVLPTK